MNYILEDMEPKRVLHFFEEICAIPHGSYHVQEISDALVRFAKDRGLKYTQDDAGNVIIRRDGSKGHENAKPLILQGHMDMVLEKADGVDLDMETRPIRLRCDGDTLYAEGTTLGGDDGIAVAMMLAALDDEKLVHPPLECVFTVNEEVGLLGAEALDVSSLKGRRMLNLDSEEEGVFTAGCAGGAEQIFHIPVEKKPKFGMQLHIEISGLRGGHSGSCINLGRANADILMGRILYRISKKAEPRILKLTGGSKDNAIPRGCVCDCLFDATADGREAARAVEKETKKILNEYRFTDPDIQVTHDWTDATSLAQDAVCRADTMKIIRFLMVTPNGVLEMDPNIKDLPQTSLNLGILDVGTDEVTATFLVRSSIDSQKKNLMKRLQCLADLVGAAIETRGEYPAWEYVKDSPFRDELVSVYEKQNGRKPAVSITHGGLECGLLAAKLKGLDCVSVGPDMEGIHTPDEKLSVSSVERLWNFLVKVMEELS